MKGPAVGDSVDLSTLSRSAAGPAQSPSQSIWQSMASQIGGAAAGGMSKIQSGIADANSPSNNPVTPVEAGLKVAAGATEVAGSPLAPLFSPIGKFIGYISDKLSNNPAVQKFAASPGGEFASRAAEDIGNATEVAGAVGGSAKSAPIESALNTAASKTADVAGSGVSQSLGALTGTGASSIKAAFNGGQAFLDAMRGKIDPEHVVQTAQDAVQNIAENRRQTYLGGLQGIAENKKSLDISPIQAVLDEKLSSFGIKKDADGNLDFSRSSIANNGSARTDVQGVYDTLRTWGTQQGDRTPVGIDTLKKQLSDFYSPSGSARALVQAVKSKVSDVLNTQVPGYQEMTGKYAATAQLLDDIKSATGIGGRAKADTIFTKLTTAMKADKEFRLQMLGELQAKGAAPDLMEQIAGTNMSSLVPKGLVGKAEGIGAAFAILGHYFQPQYIPMLLATSPRVVGEFAHALGLTQGAASTVVGAVNKIAAKGITGSIGAGPQSNQPQEIPSPQ